MKLFQTVAAAVLLIAAGCTATNTGFQPTPTPSPTPTPIPAPAVVPTPLGLSFVATGSAAAQNLGVSQTGFAGNFNEIDTCSGIVTASAVSTAGPSANYTITPLAVGSCSITITGGSGSSMMIPVTVTTSGLTVQSRPKGGVR